MSRTAVNAIVDVVAYTGLVVLATTGLMLRWQMPPGSGADCTAWAPALERAADP